MIRLPGNEELESRLDQQIHARLRHTKKSNPGITKSLGQALASPPHLSGAALIRFRLLHRQFSGNGVTGVPTLVRIGRVVQRFFRTLSWRWRS